MNVSFFVFSRQLSYLTLSSVLKRSCVRDFSSSIKPLTAMVKILNVAEKNDAAKNLAELLSQGHYRRRDGRSKFNKIYEFEYHVMGQRSQMTMTSVSGHLLNYQFVGSYQKWHAVAPVALFEAPVAKHCPKDYENIKRTLEEEARRSDVLIIWTDCDREGENIGFEVIQVCSAVNSRLRVYRARFSEITTQSVQRAINNLQQPDKRTSDAVDVRQELDLRIGAAFTRFQTLRLNRVFPETLGNLLISYGSCQFPTLGFVVERYRAIQDFVPEPFYKIRVTWEPSETETVEFSWKRNRLFCQLSTQVLLDKCEENPEALVTRVQTKPKSKWRPLPLDTVELEKLASRKLRLTAKETMKIAEKLYTQGYISYPRTETNIFPAELDLNPLVEAQTEDPNWGAFAQRVLGEGPNPRQGRNSDQAHPPIHPIKYGGNLRDDKERRVYEFIVRHFLACLSDDAKGYETVVEIDIAGEGFVASGLQIVARNYLDVYPYEKWSDKNLPTFNEGQTFVPTVLEMTEGETSPPQLLTEADLIALMEKHGIGTDATHADHIETIKERSYVGLQADGRFLPATLGMGLVQGYDAMGLALSKPHLRAELEADLKRIIEGTRTPAEVLAEQVSKYREVFVQAMDQVSKMDEAIGTYIDEQRHDVGQVFSESTAVSDGSKCAQCPNCGLDIVVRTRRDNAGFYLTCSGYPQCKTSVWFPPSVKNVVVNSQTCPTCPTHPNLLDLSFEPRSMQPFFPDNHTGCIGGCDQDLLHVLNIRPLPQQRPNAGAPTTASVSGITRDPGPRPANPSTTTSSTRGRSSSGTQNQRGNGRAGFSTVAGQLDAVSQPSVPVNPVPRNQPATEGLSGTRSTGTSFLTAPSPWAMDWSSSTASGASAASSVPRVPGVQPPGGDGRFSARVNTSNDSAYNTMGDGMDQDLEEVVCLCNENAVLLTVRKDGPNQGRQFYKCAKLQGQGNCNFFLWADAASRPAQPAAAVHSRAEEDTLCSCAEPARLLTVQKEGPNRGRQFYACPKPRDSQCGFFEWADQATAAGSADAIRTASTRRGGFSGAAHGGAYGGSDQGRGRGRGRGRATSGARRAGGPRKCGLCGEEGHTRTRCPQKDD